MLHAVVRCGVKVEVGGVDHGLRHEAAAEMDLVDAHCGQLGVPFHRLKVSLRAGAGLEAAAREARYSALKQLVERRGLWALATGHTASDQAETVLMRLGRGTALGGAAGILERREDGVLRPMLGVTRQEVRAYVEALGLAVAHDPMNDDLAYTRVRVRREVLPSLTLATGPGTERALARFARHAQEDDELLERLARTAFARSVQADGALDRVALGSLERPIQRRVLALFLELAAVPLSAELIDDCLMSIARGGTATLPRDLVLSAVDGAVRVGAAPERTHPFGVVHTSST